MLVESIELFLWTVMFAGLYAWGYGTWQLIKASYAWIKRKFSNERNNITSVYNSDIRN